MDPAGTTVQLVAMGIGRAQSKAMLELTGGNVERALELLLCYWTSVARQYLECCHTVTRSDATDSKVHNKPEPC